MAANGLISFFLWLSTAALCTCTVFFICSSVDEYLGCFHVLALVDSAAVNTEGLVSF